MTAPVTAGAGPEERVVGGWVAPGYEAVQDAFAAAADRELGAGGGAFAAYVDGVPVVDLWGGSARPGKPWQQDTIAVLMSATKGLVAVSAQVLADRGLLDVGAPVASYWPEFAANGKGSITVRQLLTHTSGVLSFPAFAEVLKWDGVGWDDYDAIAAGFARAAPFWEPGSRHGYHAMSVGWLVGEVVRRITGQTIGAFFADNVAHPLGLDLRIGTPLSEQPRVATVVDRMRGSLPLPMRLLYPLLHKRLVDPSTLAGQAYLAADGATIVDRAEDFFRQPRVLATEIPSGNGTGTARSLARLYAWLGNGGALDGVRLVSQECAAEWGAEVLRAPDALMSGLRLPVPAGLLVPPTGRSLGYLMNVMPKRELPHFGPNQRAYGHEGAGGQISFCDPESGVAAAFVRSELHGTPRTAARLVRCLYETTGRGAR